jgi:hypothetical protein
MIQPTSNSFGFHRTDASSSAGIKPQPPAKESVENTDRLSSNNSSALQAALRQQPEIRPEVVERARKLAVDPNYPPREIIMQLAKLFSASADLTEQA